MTTKSIKKGMLQEFYTNKDFPTKFNYGKSRFSVDVLAFSKKKDQHTIAWYDFELHKWQFLCREFQGSFVWRYIDDELDKPS